jgi:predicted RNase H-like HicB family nuclease
MGVRHRFTTTFLVRAFGAKIRDMRRTSSPSRFSLTIEYDREDDGRWLADIPALPGVTAYGRTKRQATVAAQVLALKLIADRLEHGEAAPGPMDVSFTLV